MKSPQKYWFWLGALTGINPVYSKKLLDAFGNAYEVFRQPPEELRKLDFLNPKLLESLMDPSARRGIEERLYGLTKRGIEVITPDDDKYPELILEITDPPPVLFMRGAAAFKLGGLPIAVVGARNPTSYGIEMTKKIVSGLVAYGFTIVSGLAAGIDAAAHKAALDEGGKTVAFLGCGVERVYPASNRELMGDIIMNGSVYSEYMPGTIPFQHNFPRRNRLISGASMGVVVVEAGERSGALITAGFAGEQGRDVFAVPGNATSPLSKGANALIRDGACIATSAADIIAALNIYAGQFEQTPGSASHRRSVEAERAMDSLSAPERGVARLLKNRGPQDIDAIAAQCAIAAGEAGSLAVMLEIRGVLRRMADGKYSYAGDG